MAAFAQRLHDLKTKVGGNREKRHYEHTFGMPHEEAQRVTMPNADIRRVLSQLEFAIRLSAEQDGRYDAALDASLAVLEHGMADDGVLTRAVCLAGEDALLPLADAAKEYEVLLVAHAHLDMNWMWGWQETVATVLSTFRTMLYLMREYPDFTFSQSQASCYKIVEDYDKAMMDEIKARIAEGRWECTAAAWVETDKNMPNTESLLRHIRYTKDYMRDVWGVDPDTLKVDFSPDTFGHNGNVPEINTFGNVPYYYHCRGLGQRELLYRWQAPSGKEVLVYCEPDWYNAGITPNVGLNIVDYCKRSGGMKTGLVVYGVGNHGGGPTRRDIERALEMQHWPVWPRLTFGAMRDYFAKAEAVRDQVPLLTEEINFIFTGCYTTQSRIKLGNRKSEAALLDAESAYTAANFVLDYHYPDEYLRRAWQGVLLTHFHDILTGSTVQEAREHAMGVYADAIAVAGTLRENTALALAARIDTSMIAVDTDIAAAQSEGAGVGYGIGNYSGVPNVEMGKGKVRVYHVFNPLPHPRTDTVEFTVWDWTGDPGRAVFSDHDGHTLEHQVLDWHYQQYWDHKYNRFLVAVTVPAMGYATVVLKEREMADYPFHTHGFPRRDFPHDPIVLENDYLKATFSPLDGSLFSLIDKATGAERIKRRAGGGRLTLVEAERGSNNAWNIGRHLRHDPITHTFRLSPIGGHLRNGFSMEQGTRSSRVVTTVTLARHARALSYTVETHWNETSWNEFGEKNQINNVPVLCFVLPLVDKPSAYQQDVPAGHRRAPGRNQDVPALQYSAAVFGAEGENERALALISDGKYGYRGCTPDGADPTDILSLTLLNASSHPDPFPERGSHKMNFWVAVDDACPQALQSTAAEFCRPMHYVSGAGGYKGDLPPSAPLLDMQSATSVFSSAFFAADGAFVIRLYETGGTPDRVTLTLPFAPRSAVLVDLDEKALVPAADSVAPVAPVAIEGQKITFAVAPYAIAAVKITK